MIKYYTNITVLKLRKYFKLILLVFCLIKVSSQTGLGINTVVIDLKNVKEIVDTETLIEVEVDLGW